ncbi:2-amino-4-oxopentanoate thiolase subunit OrtB [Tepidanaerobacter syntrophicus]|uniref:2-amino-4-oxopentanoate thiolase subunit OrtB n=1 Tax=Tepidanaerobacter syntrophicus TaxID=224999 RepID=UPI00235385CB|nr:2-amino-4-oxopentanoate thiolase subunit OrtB [Tepidanaerobacter syntrophicus]
MNREMSYEAVMKRKNQIMEKALGINYHAFEISKVAFDYEKMMRETVKYSIDEVAQIQSLTSVGSTPLIELKNLTQLARKFAERGKGARIFVKDEAANPSGSFKDRRASVSVYNAKKQGYKGVIAATSGNYGAAVASQAAMMGLKCIVVQEVFDKKGYGQPEILEKGRKCEALGAEVLQLTVGPELFYVFLCLLEETGYFNASLYSPFAIAGVETLGYELAKQIRNNTGKDPDAVVITHAGGGNVTGTARGLLKARCKKTQIIGASVDLSGLHMASDKDFNRKSFTTGHTGFGVPFATWPDRADVPRNAARPLRYLDRYVTVSQGEVFYITEALAQIEGLERGPAGNTSLAAAFAISREMDEDQIIVVQETEYTGAGKLPSAQLTFAKEMGIKVKKGDPEENIPGTQIVIPEHPSQIKVKELELDRLRKSYIKKSLSNFDITQLSQEDIKFLAEDTNTDIHYIEKTLKNFYKIPNKN